MPSAIVMAMADVLSSQNGVGIGVEALVKPRSDRRGLGKESAGEQ